MFWSLRTRYSYTFEWSRLISPYCSNCNVYKSLFVELVTSICLR